ncbi:cellulose biosynthesis protein BcsN [Neorhizobium lilium]|nr:cellulose biosynthesis protein BcsN [Neorhizobium lilium]
MADRQIISGRNEKRELRRGFGILAALLPLAISSCAGQPVQMGSTVKTVTVEQALVMPPPAGPGIVNVIERRYDNAIEQEIHLFTSAMTPGQNMLKAQVFGTVAPFRMSSNALTSTPVTEAGIASEMRRALPGIRMARSNFYVQNSYGPFGYAFGRGAGTDLCIYGWQQVRSPTGTMSPFANYGSIQIRLRVCEAGATEQKLLAIMYHFTIVGAVDAGGWNPYGEPSGVSPTLGGNGAPTYPRPASTEPMVPVIPQRQSMMMNSAPLAAPATAVRRRAADTAPVAQPATTMPLAPGVPQVPGPGGSAIPVQAGSPAPLVPSPSVSPATTNVAVPSPSCSTQKGGTNLVCR